MEIEKNNNVTIDGKPLKEYIEKVESKEINKNYKSELISTTKNVHRPIITRKKYYQQYNPKGGEVKIYTKKEMIEKYGTLPKTYKTLLENILQLLTIYDSISYEEISKILKADTASIRSTLSVLRRKTVGLINKKGNPACLINKNISVEEAYKIYLEGRKGKIIENCDDEEIIKVIPQQESQSETPIIPEVLDNYYYKIIKDFNINLKIRKNGFDMNITF